MFKISPSKIYATSALAIVALAATCVLIECLPVVQKAELLKIVDTKDPILALPSESQQYTSEQHQPEMQQVTYIVHPGQQIQYQQAQEAPQQYQQAQEAPQQYQQAPQATSEPRQEEQYVVRQQGNQMMQHLSDPNHDLNCNRRHEYVSLANLGQAQGNGETKRDYPGEILYVGQNGEAARAMSEAQELASSQENPDLSGLADNMAQSSGLSATILTEVPIKDMPQDVLEKLRRDYGVKVVATRERPGANLVINCDDYSGQDNAICSKPQTIYATSASNRVPYSPAAPSNEDQSSGEISHEHPHSPSEVSNGDEHTGYGHENGEPRRGMYITRNGETRVAGEEPGHEGYGEGYGARQNSAQNEQPDSSSEDRSGQEESNGQGERTEAQSEGDQQPGNYETNQRAGAAEEGKQHDGEQYDS